MITFAVAAGSEQLAESLFGDGLMTLDALPEARRVGPVITSWDTVDARSALTSVDVLVTGWGAPALSTEGIESAPNLRALIHAGGSAIPLLPPGADHVALSVAALENGRPVAEWTLGVILLANKSAFEARTMYATERTFLNRELHFPRAGNRDKVVGIVGASRIGRQLIDLLRPFELRVIVYDPYLSNEDARSLGVETTSLEELCRVSDIVSIHAPELPSTRHMINEERLSSMPDGATLINTSRGSLVDQNALIRELQSGRIHAALDVTEPDVLPPSSLLYDLPNVFLTPHMAGSTGTELRRLGDHVARELARFSQGESFLEPELRRPQR